MQWESRVEALMQIIYVCIKQICFYWTHQLLKIEQGRRFSECFCDIKPYKVEDTKRFLKLSRCQHCILSSKKWESGFQRLLLANKYY